MGVPIQDGDPGMAAALAPRRTGAAPSTPKDNDILKDKSVLVEGYSLLPRKQTSFFDDYSHYLQIIASSYTVISKENKPFRENISISMYTYYCVVLLWRRLLQVLSSRSDSVDEAEFIAFSNAFPRIVIPVEINEYLNGIGHIKDVTGAQRYLGILTDLTDDVFNEKFRGSYGIITAANHTAYETMPAPLILIERMAREFICYKRPHQQPPRERRTWRPLISPDNAHLIPNENLLGWAPLKPLTHGQANLLLECGLVSEHGVAWSFNNGQISHRSNITILRELMVQVSLYLASAKRNSNLNDAAMSTTTQGSIAQMLFVKSDFVEPLNEHPPLLSGTDMSTRSFTQAFTTHSVSVSGNFRYRIDRSNNAVVPNMLSFLTPQFNPPDGWMDTANTAFTSTDVLWNLDRFVTGPLNGHDQSMTYVCRIRKTTQEE
jgi:hypothetical protein